MEDGSAAAVSADDVDAEFAAVVHVDGVVWVLVFAYADCAGLPLVKPEGVWDEFFHAGLQDGFVDCHVHESVVCFEGD